MKKTAVFLLFFAIFLGFLLYIINNFQRVQTDIFSLINFKENEREFRLLKSMQNGFANDVLVVSDSSNAILEVEKIAHKYELFDEFNATQDERVKDYFKEIKELKIALLDRKIYDEILNNKALFFKNSTDSFFNQFSFKPLSLSDDFFGFSANLSLANSKISLNPSSKILEVSEGSRKFYIIKATLKQKYNYKQLINFYDEIKALSKSMQSEILISSGAIYTAFAKDEANRESIYMSLVSILLVSVLLLVAFRNFNIFFIIFVAIFGFAFGFAALLFVFKSVHAMVLVIGTSLVGLVFDFALHWLGKNQNYKIAPTSIKSMLGIFLLGLVITMSGYGIFVFSQLELLRQVAVFSFFTLFGAFLFTYFCLPLIFDGKIFTQGRIFSQILYNFENFCHLASKKITAKHLGLIFLLAVFILAFKFSNLNSIDNIKNYSSSPNELILQSKRIAGITSVGDFSDMIVVKNSLNDHLLAEKNLIDLLKKQNFISDYDSLSKKFLSKTEQDRLREIFKEAKDDLQITQIYTNLGLETDFVKNEFAKIISHKTFDLNEILDFRIAKDFKRFLLDDNTSIIYAKNLSDSALVDEILASNNAFRVSFVGMLNQNFTDAKKSAIWLKILAFCLALALLWVFFGAKISFLIMALITLGVLITLCVFVFFGFDINIFVVFGLILSSAVGIDYMIFAINASLSVSERIFGIFTAAFTSFISFFMLFFSKTNAISLFGLSVSLCIVLYAFFASVLSAKNLKVKFRKISYNHDEIQNLDIKFEKRS